MTRNGSIALVALVVLFIGMVVVFFGPEVHVAVKQPTVEASGSLPEGVTKFVDGDITCYVFDRWNAFRSADSSAGISCVK